MIRASMVAAPRVASAMVTGPRYQLCHIDAQLGVGPSRVDRETSQPWRVPTAGIGCPVGWGSPA